MSGKRRFCYHCSEYVSKSTYFEHQKELISRKSNDDSLQLQDDEHTDDFDSSNDEPEYIVSAQQCWPSTNLNQCQYTCGDGSAESHVTMVGVVIHRELYLYLPLSSPAASLNLTGALFFTRCSCIRSNKFKSQLLTTSSRRSRTSYGYNREQKEENWNRHPSEVTQA
ncbi:hypothetical protein EMCRGX_G021299 [Ephydatia muelleri]